MSSILEILISNFEESLDDLNLDLIISFFSLFLSFFLGGGFYLKNVITIHRSYFITMMTFLKTWILGSNFEASLKAITNVVNIISYQTDSRSSHTQQTDYPPRGAHSWLEFIERSKRHPADLSSSSRRYFFTKTVSTRR